MIKIQNQNRNIPRITFYGRHLLQCLHLYTYEQKSALDLFSINTKNIWTKIVYKLKKYVCYTKIREISYSLEVAVSRIRHSVYRRYCWSSKRIIVYIWTDHGRTRNVELVNNKVNYNLWTIMYKYIYIIIIYQSKIL